MTSRLLALLLLCFGVNLTCPAIADVMIPNLEQIGSSINGFVLNFTGVTNGVFPEKIIFEIEKGQLIGLIAEYPSRISEEDLRRAINERWSKFEKSISVKNVFAWRDDSRGIGAQVGRYESVTRLVLIKINKK